MVAPELRVANRNPDDPLAPYRAHAESPEFRDRLALARQQIAQWSAGRPAAVLSSWGKDAVVLVHLCRAVIEPDRMVILHVRPAVRVAGYEEVVDALTAGVSYVELPRPASWANLYGWARENDYPVVLHGHRTEEDARNRLGLAWLGVLGNGDGVADEFPPGFLRAWPLAGWSASDVWAYIAAHDVPYPSLYDLETHGFTRETIRSDFGRPYDEDEDGPNYLGWLNEHFPERVHVPAQHTP